MACTSIYAVVLYDDERQLKRASRCHDPQAPTLLLCRASFQQMAQQAPKLLNLLQTIILRSTSLSVAHALEALERSGMD